MTDQLAPVLKTIRNTKFLIPAGTVVEIRDSLPDGDGLGTFKAKTLEDVVLNVASSVAVERL